MPENAVQDQLKKIKDSSVETDKLIEDGKQKIKQLAMISNVLTLVVVVVILAFVFSMYKNITTNLTPEKILESARTQVPTIVPELQKGAVEVATAIYPVYLKEAQDKMGEALPEIAMSLEKEWQIFLDETGKKSEEQLQTALQNVVMKQEGAFRKAFPNINEEELEKILIKFMDDSQMDFLEFVLKIFDETDMDIRAISKTIDAFDTKDLPSDEKELSRLFIHYFLLYLDEEVMTKEGGKK